MRMNRLIHNIILTLHCLCVCVRSPSLPFPLMEVASQAKARQARVQEYRYVIKVMSVKRKGGTEPEVTLITYVDKSTHRVR
jgi:hypothetical protein